MSHFNGKFWWYPGLRKLMPVPWKYSIPNFGFIDIIQYKKFIGSTQNIAALDTAVIHKPIINRAPVSRKAALTNQQNLF